GRTGGGVDRRRAQVPGPWHHLRVASDSYAATIDYWYLWRQRRDLRYPRARSAARRRRDRDASGDERRGATNHRAGDRLQPRGGRSAGRCYLPHQRHRRRNLQRVVPYDRYGRRALLDEDAGWYRLLTLRQFAAARRRCNAQGASAPG